MNELRSGRLGRIVSLCLAALATGCSEVSDESAEAEPKILPAAPRPVEPIDDDLPPPEEPDTTPMTASSVPRNANPVVPAADADALRAGNAQFATDLYRSLAAEPVRLNENLFFSPYSITMALAMTYAGARADTEIQMANALHFTLPQTNLHAALNRVDLSLMYWASQGKAADGVGARLRVANSLWGSPNVNAAPAFLNLLAINYGSGIRLTEFESNPEGSRNTINAWVEKKTNNRIVGLLPPGSITLKTKLVLANAVYFNAPWATAFEADSTRPETFHGTRGDQSVPMMHQSKLRAGFYESIEEHWKAVSLPYRGGQMSLVAVLPEDVANFESTFDPDALQKLLPSSISAEIDLSLPKFTFDAELPSMSTFFKSKGMVDAFIEGTADFSGIDDNGFFLNDIAHKAFISVSETGTEAAAATAVHGSTAAAEESPPVVVFDKPFVFFIRDESTGAILFLGRVLNV